MPNIGQVLAILKLTNTNHIHIPMAPDSLSLAEKVAIVTGSGRENGIGAAIATALGRNGAKVAINYVSDTSASRAAVVAARVQALGAEAIVVQADVSTPEGAAKLVRDTLAGFKTSAIDILGKAVPNFPSLPVQTLSCVGTYLHATVNNAGAGTGQGTALLDLTPDQIHQAFALNTFSTLYMTQAAVPFMPRGGNVVNIGSIVSRMTILPGTSVYGASKAAQEYLTGAMATEVCSLSRPGP